MGLIRHRPPALNRCTEAPEDFVSKKKKLAKARPYVTFAFIYYYDYDSCYRGCRCNCSQSVAVRRATVQAPSLLRVLPLSLLLSSSLGGRLGRGPNEKVAVVMILILKTIML